VKFPGKKPFGSDTLNITLVAVVATAVQLIYLLSPGRRIGDADEAIFGMIAQHIAALREFPVFCWEAHYAGTVVSYIAAIIFPVFGEGFVQLHSAMLVFTVGTPLLCYLVYRKMFDGPVSFFSALFVVFCPAMALHYTTAAVGGYGETLFGSALIILVSCAAADGRANRGRWFFLHGLLCGFFMYVLFLAAPAAIAFGLLAVLFAERDRIRNGLLWAAGGFIGIMPMIVYNLASGPGTIERTVSRSTWLERSDIHSTALVLLAKIAANKARYFKNWLVHAPDLFGTYAVPEYSGKAVTVIAGLILISVCVIFLITSAGAIKRWRVWTEKERLQFQFAVFFAALILFVWTANLDRPRHILPLMLILPVAFGTLAERRKAWIGALPSLFLIASAANVSGWADLFTKQIFDPYPVAREMHERGIDCFYGSYWTVYPVCFVSQGDISGSPMLLPYNEVLTDRRPGYTRAVRKSPSPAFIFGRSENRIQQHFLNYLARNKIDRKIVSGKGWMLVYDLTPPVDAMVSRRWETDFEVRWPAGPPVQ
jgi:hypothetical protein